MPMKRIIVLILYFYSLSVMAQICTTDNTPQVISALNFDLSTAGEAHDNLSGLIWQRCVYGQQWDGATCKGAPVKLTWQEALQTAAQPDQQGQIWRVPTIKELSLIMDLQCMTPPLNPQLFPNAPASRDNGLWSSTPLILTNNPDKTQAWWVDLMFGNITYDDTTTKTNFVLFVR